MIDKPTENFNNQTSPVQTAASLKANLRKAKAAYESSIYTRDDVRKANHPSAFSVAHAEMTLRKNRDAYDVAYAAFTSAS